MSPRVHQVMRATAAYYDISAEALTGPSREMRFARARQVGMYLARRLTPQSTTAIGRVFKRDHTTVLHGEKKVARLIRRDTALQSDAVAIAAKLGFRVDGTSVRAASDKKQAVIAAVTAAVALAGYEHAGDAAGAALEFDRLDAAVLALGAFFPAPTQQENDHGRSSH